MGTMIQVIIIFYLSGENTQNWIDRSYQSKKYQKKLYLFHILVIPGPTIPLHNAQCTFIALN